MSALTTRKQNAISNLNTTQTIAQAIQATASQSALQQAQLKELQGQIQATRAQISDIQLSIETYEKDFIDKKSVYGGPKRIQTLQDGVIAFFFIAYIALAIAVSLVQFRETKNISVTGAWFAMFFFVGIVIVELIRRYA